MTCRVRVCRDCCCGTARKHPDVDHDGLLDLLTEQTAGHARVDVAGCLLVCERSNVVAVTPGRPGRGEGGRTVWFGEVLDPATVEAVARWVRAGGPGLAAVPAELRPRQVHPPATAGAAG